MRSLVSGSRMKEIDRRTIEDYGIPSIVLMERAALAAAGEAERMLAVKAPDSEDKRRFSILAVCGFGNNGADGIAAARILFLRGFAVTILLPDEGGRRTPEFELQLSIVNRLGIPVHSASDFIPGRCSLIIDALFGVGLSRPLAGGYLELASRINEMGAPVLSVDMPSGISSDTGAVMGAAVRADATVTFGEKKLGQALYPGREFCGRLRIVDIGLVSNPGLVPNPGLTPDPGAVLDTGGTGKPSAFALEPSDLLRIPKRERNSNKGTFGKVLVAAGSEGMAGAAFFSALAAYRCGAGLVKILTEESNRLILQERLPEAVLALYDGTEAKADPARFENTVKEQATWADVIVLGPGIGQGETAKVMVETILSESYVPVILDADALNLLAADPKLKEYLTENMILTPHMMEMSRFTGKTIKELKADPVSAAREVSAQYGAACVLKDAATVTAFRDGTVFVNESGTPAMAKGGSGDVLTGVIAGLIALGMEEGEAAAFGVYIHGLAGEAAERRYGVHSVLARELADSLSEVMRREN